MQTPSRKIDIKLQIQIILVALVMPVTLAFSGWYYAFLVIESDYPLPVAAACFGIGLLLDVICYFGNVFSFVFYKLPIPFVLSVIAYEIASFFVSWRLSICAGILGLALGIVFDYAIIIDKPFYLARKRVLVIVYMFLSFLMLGLMVGVPISNFLLGVMAGNYYSLRYEGAVLSKERLRHNLLNITIFVTAVLLVFEIIFGWLIWNDAPNIIAYLQQMTGSLITSKQLLHIIFGFGALAVIIQYLITYYTGKFLLRYRTIRILGITDSK